MPDNLHGQGCGCTACTASDSHHHVHSTYDPTYGLPDGYSGEDFVVTGGRWTDGGGYTTVLGGSGGTITWSLGGVGLTHTHSGAFYTGTSVDMGTFLSFDYEATLQRAFDEWSAYGDINFVQVPDGGGNIGVGTDATIRIVGGFIDGESGANVLARAFFPSTSALAGDIVFDSANPVFFSNENNFFLTALHEIGHSIGLNHEQTTNAIAVMNPAINTSLTGLQPDDIAGIQAVYGPATTPTDDFSDDISTTGSVVVDGAPASGNIETSGDADWFAVTLVAGETYDIDLRGASSGSGTLPDPFIEGVYDAGGTSIPGTSNDDGGFGLNSRLTFTAATSGVHYIAASSVGTVPGTYSLEVATAPALSPDLIVSSLALSSTSVFAGETLTIDFEIENIGDPGSSADTDGLNVYLSTDSTITTSDTLITSFSSVGPILPGEIFGYQAYYTTPYFSPLPVGTYYIGVIADANDGVSESDEDNNTLALSFTVSAPPTDDFSADILTTGSVAVDGGPVSGVIEVSSDTDWFAVTFVAGTTYEINLRGAESGAGTLLDTILEGIYDASGTLIPNTGDDNSGVGFFESFLTFTATNSGLHYISADGWSTDTGSYTLEVTSSVPVTDDFTSDVFTTGTVSVGGTASGTIETDGDTDWFAVSLVDGETYEINLLGAPSGLGSLPDPLLDGLYDATGAFIPGTVDDDGGLGLESRISFTAATTGLHYVSAGGFGANTGTYTVQVDQTSVGTPDLTVSALSLNMSSAYASQLLDINFDIENIGTAAADAGFTGIYISADTTITTSDLLLYQIASSGTISAGGSAGYGAGYVIPNAATLAPGTYYVGVIADETGLIAESDETNNTGYVQLDITAAPAVPDLIVDTFSLSVSSGLPNQAIQIAFSVQNNGDAGSSAFTGDVQLYLSTDSLITAADTLIASFVSDDPLLAGESISYDSLYLLPDTLAPGTYYIGALADAADAISESDETNNTASAPITITVPPPDDFSADSATTGLVAVDGPAVSGTIETSGDADWFAVSFVAGTTYEINLRGIESGAGTLFDPLLDGLYDASGTLVPGTTDDDGGDGLESRLTFTAATSGLHYVSARAFGQPTGTYTVEVDQIAVGTPDLSPSSTAVSQLTAYAGQVIDITVDINNLGTAPSDTGTIGIYLSTNTIITTLDTFIAEVLPFGPIEPGGNGGLWAQYVIPDVALLAPGTYYVGVIADVNDDVAESDETNNTDFVQFEITAPPPEPDLIVTYLGSSPDPAYEGQTIDIDFGISNIGDPGTSADTEGTNVYLSTDNVITTSDTLITTFSSVGTISAGQVIDYTTSYVVPDTLAPGTYYLGVIADADGLVAESNEANNTLAHPIQIVIAPPPIPDLIVSSAAVSNDTTYEGQQIDIFFDVENIGDPGSSALVDSVNVYLSTDPVITTTDTLIASPVPFPNPLEPGVIFGYEETYTVPDTLAPGTYYIGIIADADDLVAESDETNNTNFVQIEITAPPVLPTVTVYTGGGTLVGTATTLNDAMALAGDGYTLLVDPSYAAGPEVVNVGFNNLTIALPAGIATPEFNLLPGVVNLILAGGGDAEVNGNSIGNILIGNHGINILEGQGGNDVVVGQDGDDVVLGGGSGDDTVVGGSGNDLMFGDDGNDFMNGGTNNDTMYGGPDNDFMNGDAGQDTIEGNDGDDIIGGGADADVLTGGSGMDWLLYAGSNAGVTIDLNANGAGFQSASGGDAQGDVISGFERINGSDHGDTLIGNGDANIMLGGGGGDSLIGNLGDDILAGDAGNDTLIGGGGADTLYGGADGDIFVLTAGSFLDIIVDFVIGADLIRVDAGPGFTDISDLSISNAGADLIVGYGADTAVLMGLAGVEITNASFDFI